MACIVMAYILMAGLRPTEEASSSLLSTAYIVMACIAMAYIVMAGLRPTEEASCSLLSTVRACASVRGGARTREHESGGLGYGLYSYGLYSNVLYSYGLYSYGL